MTHCITLDHLINNTVVNQDLLVDIMYTIFDKITTLDNDLEGANIIFPYLYFLPSLKNLKINNITCTTDNDVNKLSEYLFQSIQSSTSFYNLKGTEVLKCYYSEPFEGLRLMFRSVDYVRTLQFNNNIQN